MGSFFYGIAPAGSQIRDLVFRLRERGAIGRGKVYDGGKKKWGTGRYI
jgi:hypothetical protein